MTNVARRKRSLTAQEINAELRSRGYTQEKLAKEIGRGRSTVSEVISGVTKSWYIAQAIGQVIGLEPAAIWPRLYAVAPGTSQPLAS